ncbi:12657_t:CDS:2 [Acaulospora morrowiae]|uniref:12657_t:CDS:1 n=1 Tax=Acaulospora morrowiae TaxID=94023 RepID=A0A9N8VGP5_9GLOM|nr:12657_t:CDS:2 [Acaulospora morrowiae]
MSAVSTASPVSIPHPHSQLYTCLACQVAFNTAGDQRSHYGTDWHRYNLKRKVTELPPITYSAFERKVLAQQALSKSAIEESSFSAECSACGKTYYSKNAYANHLQSNKHKISETKAAQEGKLQKKKSSANLQKDGDALQEEVVQQSIEEVIDKKIAASVRLEEIDCLFCTQRSESFSANMTHMTKVHSFFIPEAEYLVDLYGLIKFLGEKISVGNVCLYCNGRGKGLKSIEAVRKHMVDKGHCKIAYDRDEDIMEIVDFYDFTSSYPVEESEEGWEHVNDDEWEDIEDDADRNVDKEELPGSGSIYEDDMELVLPSGARLGHRSLRRYYKQSLRPEEERDSIIINRLITQYGESFGYTRNPGGVFATKGGRVKRNQTIAIQDKRRQQEFDSLVGVKANKLQRHFRAQIL